MNYTPLPGEMQPLITKSSNETGTEAPGGASVTCSGLRPARVSVDGAGSPQRIPLSSMAVILPPLQVSAYVRTVIPALASRV